MPERASVVIVGGGIVGCALAAEFVRRGWREVRVLERATVGGQASIAYAGLLAVPGSGALDDPLSELGTASLARFPAVAADLRERTGIDVELRRTGALLLAFTADEETALRAALPVFRARDAACCWLDRDELRQLEPAVSPLFRGALLLPYEHQVLAPRLVEAFARAAALGGARIDEGVEVIGFERAGARVRAVVTRSERIAADQVVVAAGAWSGALAAQLGLPLPLGPLRGQLVRLHSWDARVRHTLYRGDLYLAVKADGTVAVGSTEELAVYDRRPTLEGVRQLVTFAHETVPALGQAVFREALAGLRPWSADGLPVLGRLPGYDNVWIASGHARNGVLLSPITAEVLADLLEGKTPTLDLTPFDPARFAR
ncbi:MAG: glycine oxidase ThiO [Thermomicrobium sp.]|nr:glycine oxidase ThiO [Thermomicrobium sp.]MDW8060201.1 glycine oxidase ThiO [Thermomicrobium sp.]